MKSKLKLFFALIPAMLLLYGCPVGMEHTLGTPGTEKIDKKLLGTWTTTDTTIEFSKVTIEEKDDYSYTVKVSDRSESYMIDASEFTAWVTTIGENKFIYSQPTDADDKDYYLYHYKIKGDKLVSQVVSLLVNGSDGVKSTEDYRKEVEESIKMEGGLSDEVVWERK